jgi:DNA-binding response OmpR family regulator
MPDNAMLPPEEITCELVGSKYIVGVGGRKAILPYTPGKILTILMNQPENCCHTHTLVDGIYGHREDGGPNNAEATIKVHVHHLRRKLREAGIALDLRSRPWKGYEYYGATALDHMPETRKGRRN